jgi:hypothetical protein
MKKRLALAALVHRHALGRGPGWRLRYGHSYGYAPSHGYVTTYVERPSTACTGPSTSSVTS